MTDKYYYNYSIYIEYPDILNGKLARAMKEMR